MPACPGPATVVFDQTLTEYDFGPSHPMSPIRVDLTMRLARELGVLDRVRTVPGADGRRRPDRDGPRAGDDGGGHARAARTPTGFDPSHGLGSDDNPVFHDMHRAASHVVGATAEAFRQVWSGESLHSANITGGLHHAMPDHASGFCIYNDVADRRSAGCSTTAPSKVAYVDVDVHHGDGVERIFYDDPRVLTISLHETGQTLFPGTGFPQDVGGPDARGQRGQRRPAARYRRTPAGCAPSTRSCRRCCASSHPTSWSPSTAATATATTRSPT